MKESNRKRAEENKPKLKYKIANGVDEENLDRKNQDSSSTNGTLTTE